MSKRVSFSFTLLSVLFVLILLAACDVSLDSRETSGAQETDSPISSATYNGPDYSQYVDAHRRYAAIKSDAGKDNTDAVYLMGEALFEGHGVEKDPQEALRLTRMAAARGHVMALLRMAEIYKFGYLTANQDYFYFDMLVMPDDDKAQEYESKALDALREDIRAGNFNPNLVAGYASRLEMGSSELIPEDLEEAQRLYDIAIAEWKARAKTGHYPSMLQLADVYGEGLAMQMKNPDKAERWRQEALATGHPEPKRVYSDFIEDSQPTRARSLLSEAANAGWGPAMNDLASIPYGEERIPWLIKAYEQRADVWVAKSIARDFSDKDDYENAFIWLAKTFDDTNAHRIMSSLHLARSNLFSASDGDVTRMKETEEFRILRDYVVSFVGLCDTLESTTRYDREVFCGLSDWAAIFRQ